MDHNVTIECLYTVEGKRREVETANVGRCASVSESAVVETRRRSWNSAGCSRSDTKIRCGSHRSESVNLKATVQYAVSTLLAAMVLFGCSSNVTMTAPTIPTPLIAKIPMSVGLRMPEEFEHFVHEEQVLGRESWSIDLGRSHAALFTQLFEHMFGRITILNTEDDAGQFAIDALIEPSIDAFEFSVPNQSKTDAFAVWIRYRLKVYDRNGELIANWPLSAYGKSQTAGIGGSEALRHAAVLAMRDAAALMIMQLDKATGISALGSSTEPVSTGVEADDDEVRATARGGSEDDSG